MNLQEKIKQLEEEINKIKDKLNNSSDLKQEVNKLDSKMDEIFEMIKSLGNSSTIPIDVDAAFRDRFLQDLAVIQPSTVGATTHNKTVNEGGTDVYAVMNKPDGFVQSEVNGSTVIIPYFNP